MKKCCIIVLALLAVFVLGSPAHAASAQTERVTVKATGSGADREEALKKALKEAAVTALSMFSGTWIDSDNLDEDEAHFVRWATRYGREHHTVLSEAEHRGAWRVTVETTIDLDELKMFACNESAKSDVRNAATNEAGLFTDIQAFGATCRGTLNNHYGCGMVDGSMNDIILYGVRTPYGGGKESPGTIGLDVSRNVSLRALVDDTFMSYVIYGKHKEGNRVYAADSDSGAIYFCENKEWAGMSGLPAKLAFSEVNSDDLNGKECGGSPVGVWQVR